jgi:hypothetical protein
VRNPVLFSVCALLVSFATPGFGQECNPSPHGPSRYCFALDFIEALRIAHNAYTLYGDDDGLAPCGTQGSAIDVIYRAKQREQAFGRVLRLLRESAASLDSSIQLTRDALRFAILPHFRLSRDAQRYCKHMADRSLPTGFETPSQMADSAASARLRIHNAAEMLFVAVGEISDGLAEMDPATDRLTILRLSAEQRQTLLETLASAFGPEVTTFDPKNPKMLGTDFATIGATFYAFLADKVWRLQPITPNR